MIRLLDGHAELTLSLLEDYLARLEDEMEGEIIWEDRPYAERVDQAILDTKHMRDVLEAKVAEAASDVEEDSNVILCPDCGKRHHHRYCEKE